MLVSLEADYTISRIVSLIKTLVVVQSKAQTCCIELWHLVINIPTSDNKVPQSTQHSLCSQTIDVSESSEHQNITKITTRKCSFVAVKLLSQIISKSKKEKGVVSLLATKKRQFNTSCMYGQETNNIQTVYYSKVLQQMKLEKLFFPQAVFEPTTPNSARLTFY